MTNPEQPSGPPAYALCLSDAGFSRAVLSALRRRGCPPQLAALPEYAPAARRRTRELLEMPGRELADHIGDLPLVYVPRNAQHDFATLLRERGLDCLLVACWPYLLDRVVIDAVPAGALNLHPSLLPRYRGADPIGAQLRRGDPDFGVSLHLLDAHFDHGDLIAQAGFDVDPDDRNRGAIERRAAELGVDLFIEALRVGAGSWEPLRQDELPDTD